MVWFFLNLGKTIYFAILSKHALRLVSVLGVSQTQKGKHRLTGQKAGNFFGSI